MEDMLEVYSRPYDESYPVVCMDEKPVQFFADFRKGFRSKKDGVQYEDYQYIRNGTASIFLFTEPLAGWRYADAQERRTAQDWTKQIEWLLTEQYPVAKRVVLVMDNLNTHSIASLYATFPPQHASLRISPPDFDLRCRFPQLFAKGPFNPPPRIPEAR